MISSHSVAGAIKQPFLLRRLDWTSLALLCLWSLSPLAGQAFLRMAGSKDGKVTYSGTLHYVNVSGQSVAFSGTDFLGDSVPNVDIIFESSIIAPLIQQQAVQDAWNNTKIPILESLGDLNTTDSSGWYTVDDSSTYSSLVGVPVFGMLNDSSIDTDLSIRSSYYRLVCPALQESSFEKVNASALAEHINLEFDDNFNVGMGINPPANGSQGKLFFTSFNYEGTYVYTSCSFNQSYVESRVLCSNDPSLCYVDQMRYDPKPALYTPSADDFRNMSAYFVNSGSGNLSSYTPKQFFLSDPSNANSPAICNDTQYPNLLTVPPEDFTARLSLLFNIYWQAGVEPFDVTGMNDTSNAIDPLLQTDATFTNTTEVFYTNWPWLILLLISSTILLTAGVAGAILDSRTIGPDIFGFASSLAHRNKYMRVEQDGGSAMSGAARARLLEGVTVMLQDVRPDWEVGKIALGTVENGGERLKMGRLYT